MLSQPDSANTDYAEVAESVRSGEYFRKARTMYDFSVHDLMTERYLYLLITILSFLIFLIAFIAMRSLYPLSTPVPFTFNINNPVDDIPNIRPLTEYKGEDTNKALLQFFAQNYIAMHEEYSIDTFERDISGVGSQSSPAVLAEFQRAIDLHNPGSPVALYQRVAKRVITVVSSKLKESGDEMEIIYEAAIEGKGEVKKSLWQANIAFKYSGLTLDEKTGKVKPASFMVTQYRVKRLQDTR